MKILNWFHRQHNAVISNEHYSKLPHEDQKHFEPTEQEPTHKVVHKDDEDNDGSFAASLALGSIGGFGLGMLGGSIAGAAVGSIINDSVESSHDFQGFSGGDGGGGGAGADYSPNAGVVVDPFAPDSSNYESGSSSDYSSSDSSSSDSGGSYDSGSSSDNSSF